MPTDIQVNVEQGLYPAGINTAIVSIPDEPSKSDLTMGSQPLRSALAICRLLVGGTRNGEQVWTLAVGYERWLFQISRDSAALTPGTGAEYGTMNISKMMTVTAREGQNAGIVPQGQTFAVTGMRAFPGMSWCTPVAATDVFLFGNLRHDAWLRNSTFGMSIVEALPLVLLQHGTVRWEWQTSDTKCQETIGALHDFYSDAAKVSAIDAPIYQLRRDLVPGANHINGKKLVLTWPDGLEFTAPAAIVPATVPDLIGAFRYECFGYSVCGEIPGESNVCMPPGGVRVQQGAATVGTEMFNAGMAQIRETQATVRQIADNQKKLTDALTMLMQQRGLPAGNG